ncbi:bifunctional peptidase and arginyl-hydroxylase JMJD5 [Culex pipiens pallens]|uniref:bifunctional peptidase and arginyl-hydroxylase JMJD5 n=1 Tax=Culex pipiens pallens TaxID=42434 RepID=UPI0019534437|nr:bifunctional peptidase and arginyl-hydroxylase JMJD5 [Culex pipiens pallens]
MEILPQLFSFAPNVLKSVKTSEYRKLYRDVIIKVTKPIIDEVINVEDVAENANDFRHNLIRIGISYDLVHSCLHTGEWHAVPAEQREVFTLLSFLRILYMLICGKGRPETVNDAIYVADMGLMLGAKVLVEHEGMELDLLAEVVSILTKANKLGLSSEPPLKRLKVDIDDSQKAVCEAPILNQPTLEYFGTHHYDRREPALLEGIIEDWPALERWHDPNYLIAAAGERTVPVEVGSQYSSDDWSQRLVKFKDFIAQHLMEESAARNVDNEQDRAYLAQHELFDQIPTLREDIRVPDYIGRTDTNPRIKAWLGPKGTVSPLHTDPGHNLLCQVFGSKTIILAPPDSTPNLYPHEHFILNNTSQIVDAKAIDYERFPRARDVRFRRLELRRGQVLYIPPGWWHYVESLAPSFSVSFWFD